MRNLYPEKISISPMRLVAAREFEYAHRGPGTYALAHEKGKVDPLSAQAAFGANAIRPLDTTVNDVIKNPAPNAYSPNNTLNPKNAHKVSATFATIARNSGPLNNE